MGRYLRTVHRTQNSPIFGMFVGILCGILIGPLLWKQLLLPMELCSSNNYPAEGAAIFEGNMYVDVGAANSEPDLDNMQLLLVGVMTAKKYLHTRAVTGYKTWASQIPGRVIFFSSEGTVAPSDDFPLIALPGVDDSYPPQKKSFLMLKYMHDRYGNQFEWFMRADDDLYIKGDGMQKFLHSLNSSKPHFIGQAGQGTKEEFGQLALDQNENFCMGGPGIVMSRATLASVVPRISYCLKNLYTTHEDVEVGRCIKKFVGISCTWAFEMQMLFYHNYMEPNGSFTHSLKMTEVHRAITMHPVKNHSYHHRIHGYLLSRQTRQLRHDALLLHREIHNMELLMHVPLTEDQLGLPPSLSKFLPKHRADILPWEFITGKAVLSDLNPNPKRGYEMHFKTAIFEILMEVMQMINKNARQRGRTIDFNEVLYGYRHVNPMFGAEYILDLLLIYRKHKGRKMTVPVRRHAYLQQAFTEIQFREESLPKSVLKPDGNGIGDSFIQLVHKHIGRLYQSKQPYQPIQPQYHYLSSSSLDNKTINFILPLAGRFQTFLHFMNNFEEVCLKNDERVSLALMLFHSDMDDRTEDTIAYVDTLQKRYPSHNLRVVLLQGKFTRGVGLQEGAKLFPDDALLFFVDVDIYMNRDSLQRIRYNVIKGEQVYFPIVFSQYDPQTMCDDTNSQCNQRSSPFQFGQDYGYWRQFGFGIAALHKSELIRVGGFDMSITGWGKEDVDLYQRFLEKNITIFRSVDPGMVHIFHPIVCDPKLEEAQYQMCLGSQVSTYGSTSRLANIVYNTADILHKNEVVEEEEIEQAVAADGR